MALACEDLSSYGVVLIPPDSQQYFDLLADIERRLQNRPQGAPPLRPNVLSRISEHDTSGSAILVNRSKVAIAAVAFVWSYRLSNGRISPISQSPGANPSVLLAFLLAARNRKVDAYWRTIFPGSKRWLTIGDGVMYGDNTDVRPPAPDELSRGGGGSVGSGLRGEAVKLTLDGVFFVDGGFAGPNQLRSWEELVAAREAYLSASALARSAAGRADFFASMDQLKGPDDPRRSALPPTAPPIPGPPPPAPPVNRTPEAIREYQQQSVARAALRMRNVQGDAAAIAAIAAWLDTPGPEPHRL